MANTLVNSLIFVPATHPLVWHPQVWVLTGDKLETAINIALACRLFTQSMSLVEMRDRDFQNVVGTAAEAEVRAILIHVVGG